MAATLSWRFSTVSSATYTTLSGNLRFKNANDNNDDTANPMVRPTSGTDYSFEKKLRIFIDTGSTFTALSSLRVYHAGSIGSGIGGNITQYYSFRSAESPAPAEATTTGSGALPTSLGAAVAWTGIVDHLFADGTNVTWNSSYVLLTWLGVAAGGSGGSATWTTTAVWNEI